MIDLQNGADGNPINDPFFELTLAVANRSNNSGFIRIPIIIACTILTFVLLIAGTATTAISYPPYPPQLKAHLNNNDGQKSFSVTTALDGDYKLLGPLLIMAGGFLLIVDIALCTIVTREAYKATQSVTPKSTPEPMSLVGGPFFLAAPPSITQLSASPFSNSRDIWAVPNAPLPDYMNDQGRSMDSKIRPSTATLSKCHQPPFNPGASSS